MLKAVSGAAGRRINLHFIQEESHVTLGLAVLEAGWRGTE
jgi:hypothetical protein